MTRYDVYTVLSFVFVIVLVGGLLLWTQTLDDRCLDEGGQWLTRQMLCIDEEGRIIR